MILVQGYIEIYEIATGDLVERAGLKGPIALKDEGDGLTVEVPPLKEGQAARVKLKPQVMREASEAKKIILPGGPI